MVVDAHTHVYAPVSERFPRDTHELSPAEAEAPAETLLEEMDRAGVDGAVIVPLSEHDEYVADVLERYPGRFAAIGVASAVPDVDGYRRRREVGLQGLRMYGLEPESMPLLAELASSGGKLWFYGGRAQTELLAHALEELPELVVVLNHLGYWPGAMKTDAYGRPSFSDSYSEENLELVAGLARFPNVHVLLSGFYAFSREPPPYRDLLPVTAALIEAYSPSRLLAATDFPWIVADPGYRETFDALDVHLAPLDAAGRGAVRGGNAESLFFS